MVVLGSTGSIGTSALEVAAALPDRVEVVGLVAHTQWQLLARQCHAFRPATAILTDGDAFEHADRTAFPAGTRLLHGPYAVTELVQSAGVDMVLAAIVGVAGLAGTLAALEAGKDVALANKEALVVGGAHVVKLAARTGGRILPVDSEHSAIHQALAGHTAKDVARVVLTASGGPFRGRTSLEGVTPEQALAHPTWDMGPVITVNSATLINKGLEVIEAHLLFDVSYDDLAVVVHPQSLVHSMVEFTDGSTLAQLSPPDMRLPIALGLGWPDRVPGCAPPVDWTQAATWTFEPLDERVFGAVALCRAAGRTGGTAPAALNAANEVCVEAFLSGRLPFAAIVDTVAQVVDEHDLRERPTLVEVLETETQARARARFLTGEVSA